MTYPKISVITPSLNQGKYIRQNIDSVLSQDYPNTEHIIIDGKSTDNTVSILKQYSRHIRWVSKTDSGQANAVNKGLRMATGDIITYLNSDDYYLPHTLRHVAQYFNSHSDAMWLTGQCRIVNNKEQVICRGISAYKNFLRLLPHRPFIYIVNFIDQPSTFWRKELLTQIGLFDENLRFCLDYDYWLRIIQIYPLHYLKIPLSAFRVHGSSKGSSQFIKQFSESGRVASRYSPHKLFVKLNDLHNEITTHIYKLIK